MDLTEDEYHQYKRCVDTLADYHAHIDLFRIVEANYREWCAGLEHAWATFENDRRYYQHSTHHHQLMIESNRLLLNWLGAIRCYFDHTAHALSRTGIPNAKERYHRATQRLYDEHFAYRFIYRLRNYAQHQGTPINAIQMSEHTISENESTYFQLIGFNRDRLLEYEKWSEVRQELEVHSETFSAEELVNDMMTCMRSLSEDVDCLYLPALRQAIAEIRMFVEPARGYPGNPCILFGFSEHVAASRANDVNPDPQFSSTLHLQWVPLDWIAVAASRLETLKASETSHVRERSSAD